jgi:hypothetical protein
VPFPWMEGVWETEEDIQAGGGYEEAGGGGQQEARLGLSERRGEARYVLCWNLEGWEWIATLSPYHVGMHRACTPSTWETLACRPQMGPWEQVLLRWCTLG